MEQGLFSRLQSYFDSSFGGRYVACLIKESIEENPRLAKVLFDVNPSDTLRLEYRFNVGAMTRIADLAFFDVDTQQLTCLIELKYDDHKSQTNAKQIDLYLRYCRKHCCRFLMVSQHCPPSHLVKKLPSKDSLRLFSNLAERLTGKQDSVGGMLRRFFVDRGLVMHKFEEQDRTNLKSFALRLLTPWGGQGRIHSKDAMDGGVADSFGYLLRNMNIIAKEVATHENGKAPTIDFQLDPWVNLKKIQRRAGIKDESINVENAKDGGRLYVYGRIRLDDSSYKTWMQLEFGIGLEVNRGFKDLDIVTFAGIYSRELGQKSAYVEKAAGVTILDHKERAVSALKSRIETAIDRAKKRDISKKQSGQLERFKKRLA